MQILVEKSEVNILDQYLMNGYVDIIKALLTKHETSFDGYSIRIVLINEDADMSFCKTYSSKVIDIVLGANSPVPDVIFSIYHEFKHALDFADGRLVMIDIGNDGVYETWFDNQHSFRSDMKKSMFDDIMTACGNDETKAELEYHKIYASVPHELSANVFAAKHCVASPVESFLKISYETGLTYVDCVE